MIFEINFKYKESQEFYLKTYSTWYIKGEGTWEVDVEDLIGELKLKTIDDDSIKTAIEDYLQCTLDKDPDFIEFNEGDLKSLIKYIKENYENQ